MVPDAQGWRAGLANRAGTQSWHAGRWQRGWYMKIVSKKADAHASIVFSSGNDRCNLGRCGL